MTDEISKPKRQKRPRPPTPFTERLLRIEAVAEKTGLAPTTVWAGARDGTFPAPLRVSTQVTAWKESEVDAWIATLPRSDPAEGHSPKHRAAPGAAAGGRIRKGD